MHRMLQRTTKVGLHLLLTLALFGSPAAAEVIRPDARLGSPQIAGAIVGTQSYTYDPITCTGRFRADSVPYLLTRGPNATDELSILPGEDGVRSEAVDVRLDESGRLVDDPSNRFVLRGTVTVGTQTYRGTLLQGTPTAFSAGAGTASAFELNVAIDGGALAHLFGSEAYLRFATTHRRRSEHGADFRTSFQSTVEESRAVGLSTAALHVAPITEPTALAMLVASGWWVLFRKRSRQVTTRVSGAR
ncbi:MAG: hypothetical protein P4L84_30025 [Isosphaeraceae bacterium]|nr:hypothetical protein [Isosphaeraceae bacterium]